MNSLGAWFQNIFRNRHRYRVHPEAAIIACFYNPQGNPYRLLAFQKWYRSIRHLPHRIIECLIGPNAKSQLPQSPYITKVHTDSLLWHKEALLNKIVRELPDHIKYVFWLDTDVLFTNLNWMVQGVKELQSNKIIQPFEYCIHLKKNQLQPDFDVDRYREWATNPNQHLRHPQLWRSFAAVYTSSTFQASSDNYEYHGHVGFAWGARREVLERCPLYDRGLSGGADHIIAHAAAGHIPHNCITRAFAGTLDEVQAWSRRFHNVVGGQIGYVSGDLYHIWHGDLKARDYLRTHQTVTRLTADVHDRDSNGLYIDTTNSEYIKRHYARREARTLDSGYHGFDAGFLEDMGYNLADLLSYFGQATYTDPVYDEPPAGDQDTLPSEPFFAVPSFTPVEPAPEPPASYLGPREAQEGPGQGIETPGQDTDSFGSTFS